MKFLVVELILATLVGTCFSAQDTFGDEIDHLVQKLRETASGDDHVMSRYRFVEGTILLKNNEVFEQLATEKIILQGIQQMKRTSPALGEFCRCLIQEVDRVQLSVPRGFNMTTTVKFEEPNETHTGKLLMKWRNPAEPAVFNLKKVSLGDDKYKVGESSNNIFNEKFDFNFVCDNPLKQEKCDQLKSDYLENSADFDLHRYFQNVVESAISKIDYDYEEQISHS